MTRKLVVCALVLGVLSASVAVPAQAAKKKKKKKAAPVATTLYMEGTSNIGEEDQIGNATYLKLQAAEGSGEKSMGMPNYMVGPNASCAGNSLVPVFVGAIAGRVVGDLKLTFSAMSTPGNDVEIRVWPDLAAQACNDAYIEPAGSVVVDLPPGEGTVEATIEGLDFEALGGIMIQFTPTAGSLTAPSAPPGYARVFYGTADSKVEFECVPASGAASCLP